MNQRARLDRLEQNVRRVRPSPGAVRVAMDRFRKTGELPEDVRLAGAVTEWAELGINAYEHDENDANTQAMLIRAYMSKAREQEEDVVMDGLYEDAVYAPEPARGLAREMLRTLAMAGHDPSTPVWKNLGWTVPKMTCNSMAMSIAGFPLRFVNNQDRRRTNILAGKLEAYGKVLGKDDVRIDAFLDAINLFQQTGELPDDPEVAEAVLYDAEITAYLRSHAMGEDHSRLTAALRAYWAAPAGNRAAAIAEVRAAVIAGPEAGDPEAGGRKIQRADEAT